MTINNEDLFSKRNGFHLIHEPEIVVRYAAPRDLKLMLVQIAENCGIKIFLRKKINKKVIMSDVLMHINKMYRIILK